MVHQINYTEIEPSFYPVETLVADKATVTYSSILRRRFLEAGGIPSVILYYRDALHMELAVDLGYQPVDTRGEVYSVTYQSKTYYVGGGDWRLLAVRLAGRRMPPEIPKRHFTSYSGN